MMGPQGGKYTVRREDSLPSASLATGKPKNSCAASAPPQAGQMLYLPKRGLRAKEGTGIPLEIELNLSLVAGSARARAGGTEL